MSNSLSETGELPLSMDVLTGKNRGKAGMSGGSNNDVVRILRFRDASHEELVCKQHSHQTEKISRLALEKHAPGELAINFIRPKKISSIARRSRTPPARFECVDKDWMDGLRSRMFPR